MKNPRPVFFSLLLIVALPIAAQRPIEQSVPLKPGQTLSLDIEDAELVRLHTWSNPSVMIKGTVSINRGENDDAFELKTETTGTSVSVVGQIKDKDKLPRYLTINLDGREYFFKTDNYHSPEVQQFLEDHGAKYDYMSNGIVRHISMEIYVPERTVTSVTSKFGMVEVLGFVAPLTVESKFGGIDATITAPSTGQLKARTEFGEIYTNLEVRFSSIYDPPELRDNRWIAVVSTPGTGPTYNFESKFGNIYLRRSE